MMETGRAQLRHLTERWVVVVNLFGVDRAQAREHFAWVLSRAYTVSSKAEDCDTSQPGSQILFDLPLCLLSLNKSLILAGSSAF